MKNLDGISYSRPKDEIQMCLESLAAMGHADYQWQRNLLGSKDKANIKEQNSRQLRNLPMGAGRLGSIDAVYHVTRELNRGCRSASTIWGNCPLNGWRTCWVVQVGQSRSTEIACGWPEKLQEGINRNFLLWLHDAYPRMPAPANSTPESEQVSSSCQNLSRPCIARA